MEDRSPGQGVWKDRLADLFFVFCMIPHEKKLHQLFHYRFLLLLPFSFHDAVFGSLAMSKNVKVPLCMYRITSHSTAAPLICSHWLMQQPLRGSSINLHTILMCQSSHWVYCQPIQVL